MVLKKKYIHENWKKGQAESQITVDDDFNISDNKPDVVKVIQEKGNIKIEEIKTGTGHIFVKGLLEFQILYKSDQSDMRIAFIEGSIPFQESLSMDAIEESDTVKIKTQIEDLSIGIINSRKLSIRALVELEAVAETVRDEAIAYDVEEEEAVEKRIHRKNILKLLVAKRDNCRFKNEILIPSNKPNVSEVLWKNVELRGIETRLKDGKIEISAEALVFVLYRSTEEENLQWIENSLPLRSEVECSVPGEESVFQIGVVPGMIDLSVKPDYDGEERMFMLDLVLDLDIHIWNEEEVDVLEDLYSLKKQIIPVRQECQLERLLMKNYTKCKVAERLLVPKEEGSILQICTCLGKAAVEKSKITERGVEAEGTIEVRMLFVTAEDASPLGAYHAIIPFSQLIEVENMKEDARIELEGGIEQLSAVLVDGSTIEIKAVLNLNLIAFAKESLQKIDEVAEEELDFVKLQQYPGIMGYIVKDGDSMWKIAKENHTTVENILETNELTGQDLKIGEKLLIVKAL